MFSKPLFRRFIVDIEDVSASHVVELGFGAGAVDVENVGATEVVEHLRRPLPSPRTSWRRWRRRLRVVFWWLWRRPRRPRPRTHGWYRVEAWRFGWRCLRVVFWRRWRRWS